MADYTQLARRTGRIVLQVAAALFLASVAWVLVYRWVAPPATWIMLERRAHPPIGRGYYGIRPEGDRQIRYTFCSLDEVSPNVPLALVAAEDQRFLVHHGFDGGALWQAAKHNWEGGSKLVGGSTISQQVAKNVFLWHGRSYVRKAAEAYFTVLIEVLWNKRRIMEMYMSVAEMGDCMFGVEAASQQYFHKSASKLTQAEAALLAGVLPNPLRFRASNPGPQARAKQQRVVRRMRSLRGSVYVKELMEE
ncbi:monofunctional biosynthetic peptidoglycan transglycosylase [Hymenobacter defluvii]|uniref:Biosynthetic peptidoglycan transglycosylase n=1 Tax=Hymenobacter defluvii TaxID=2054411 RepID=A0ABS3T7L7_9BACT|nr:monofunctional biosynthetic peptidoglycan transglycosylase [Hymenobacter defluvii]